MNRMFFHHVTIVYYNKVVRSEILSNNFSTFRGKCGWVLYNLISCLGVNNLFKEVVKDNWFLLWI
jgi:hypothetical protein